MALFVLDASATLPWCFEDESTPWSESILDRIESGDTAIVPAHWLVEVTNGMLMAVRRKRITIEKVREFLNAFVAMSIEIEPAITLQQIENILFLSHKRNLTIYDTIYLQLAKQRRLPLATLDTDLRTAAAAESVLLL